MPLAPLTTWRIGGQAQWLVEPEREACIDALRAARARGLPHWFLGRGSNILVADAGLPGLVLMTRNTLQGLHREGSFLVAEAGVSLPRLAKAAAAEGFVGYEFLIGIPGTVGGAVVMNAGFKPGDPRDTRALLAEVEVLEGDGSTRWISRNALQAGYRSTCLQDEPERFVLRARFRLSTPGEPEHIRAITREHLLARKRTQPLTRPTAGSIFRATRDGVPAAVLIDQAGLKGAAEGGAIVSHKHANWIENLEGATAADIIALVRLIRERVHKLYGVFLQPEIRYLHPGGTCNLAEVL